MPLFVKQHTPHSTTPSKSIIQLALNQPGPNKMPVATGVDYGIVDVWAHNLDDEFVKIREMLPQYSFVAMDTEFPGVVARPVGEFRSTAEYQYKILKCNVDTLNLIQIGLSFMDAEGNHPACNSCWQFNFKFSLSSDMYAQDSIELLTNAGIQFAKHESDGIEPNRFAELLITSGFILTDDVWWISFHSGFDFGYLMKLLTGKDLSESEQDFFEILRIYFPKLYDVKYLMKSCKNLKGGLQEVSDQLEVSRIGPAHQAGSDSLLTGSSFFKMREMFFENKIDEAKYCGHLYGYGASFSHNGNTSTTATSITAVSSSATATTTTTTPSGVESMINNLAALAINGNSGQYRSNNATSVTAEQSNADSSATASTGNSSASTTHGN